jgi:cytidyltransferase-like protein
MCIIKLNKEVKLMKRVGFFNGTFDILSPGHCRAFALAKEHCDYLVVGLNSDSLVRWFKLREPINSFSHRKEVLEHIREIDEIIETHEPAAIRYLQKYDAQVYILTEEWAGANAESIEWIEAKGGKVVFSPRWEDCKSNTQIREQLYKEFGGSA